MLALTGALGAQEKYPLREVVIAGARHFDERAFRGNRPAARRDGRRDGLPAGPGTLDSNRSLRDALLSLRPQDGGYTVTFEVAEVDQIFPVRLLNFDEPEPELLAALRAEIPLFDTEVPATGKMVDRIGRMLQQRWAAAGRESKVIGQLLPIDGENLAMVFQPEQRLQTIAFVEIKGAAAINPLELQRIFNPKAMGEPYSEARLLQLLHYNLRPVYEEKGYLGVEFCPCEARPDDSSLGLIVTVEVREGDVYSYGTIQRPEAPAVSPAKLDKLFDFSSGQRVNMNDVTRALGELDEHLRTMGFLKSQTLVERKTDDKARTLDLVFTTELGPQYVFRRLEIQGLDILAEPVVRQRWGLQPGQPFNAGYPRLFLDRIEQEGMFERLAKTEARTRIDKSAKSVDVTLVFNGEAPPKQYVPEAQRPKEPF